MADLIDRQAAIERFNCVDPCGTFVYCDSIIGALKALPSVDAVPVVRCKDCAYCVIDPSDGLPYCPEFYERTVEPDDYCSKAVRKKRGELK